MLKCDLSKHGQGQKDCTLADYTLSISAADGGLPYMLVFQMKGQEHGLGKRNVTVTSKVQRIISLVCSQQKCKVVGLSMIEAPNSEHA